MSREKGFTLMEMLVALGLFSIIVVIAADLFLTFQRVSRKTESLETLVAASRTVVERLAREVREGAVDFAAYTGRTGPFSDLRLITAANENLAFAHDICGGASAPNCLTMTRGTAVAESLTGSEVRVRELKFFVRPEQNPFELVRSGPQAGQYQANVQPTVTLFLSLENLRAPSDSNYVSYDVQTTITSRVYRR